MADAWTDRLSEYVDDGLTPAERLALERHLLDCASCRAVLVELREVIDDAAALQDAPPSRDLWPQIAAALPVRPSRAWRISLTLPQAIAAGVLLMLLSGGGVWWLTPRPAATMSATEEIARPTVVSASFSDPKYDRAVADLMRVLQENRGRLKPRTVAVLDRSLAAIDHAIADARAALERDPGDPFLNSHLAEQRQRKLVLLREAGNLARSTN